MCTVSVIYDYGRNMDPNGWDRNAFQQFRKLLEEAKKFDEKTNQSDCEDPEKAKWIEVVERNIENQP